MANFSGPAVIYVLTDSQSSIAYISDVMKPNPPYLYKQFWMRMFDFWQGAGLTLTFGFVRGVVGIMVTRQKIDYRTMEEHSANNILPSRKKWQLRIANLV